MNKKQKIKNKKCSVVLGITAIFIVAGVVGALNGWYGGGADIPEDTFTRGLVAYWSFDEGSGQTAYDASGNGNNGTLTNGPKWTKGKSGSALQFDGTDDYVEVSDDESLDITDAITIEAWVKAESANFGTDWIRSIIKKDYAYILRIEEGTNKLSFHVWTNNTADSQCEVSLSWTTGEWYHVVGTYDGSYQRIYRNSQVVQTKELTGTIDTSTKNFLIGGITTGAEQLHGLIDEVRIYNRALSEEEIRYHYNRGAPVAHWKFDSGKHGSALSFDGEDDYVEVPDSGDLNWEKVTLEAWIFPYDTWACQFIISKYLSDSNKDYCLGIEYNQVYIWYEENGGDYKEHIGSVTSNEWQHIAVVYTSWNSYKVYINGELVGSDSGTSPNRANTSANVEIGYSGPFYNKYYFNGLIDDVRIYNYARTADEIRLDYNAGYAARFGPTSSCDEDPGACMTKGLVGYWSFDEGSGSTAYDASDNGNNGTIYGAKWTQGAPAPSGGGTSGTGLSFDGVDDYVDCGNDDSLNPQSITFLAWIKINEWRGAIPYHEPIVKHSDGCNANGYGFTVNHRGSLSKNLNLVSYSGGTNPGDFSSGETLEVGKWYQVGFIWESLTPSTSRQKLILNGKIIKTRDLDIPVPSSITNNLFLGRGIDCWEDNKFNGLIDEVRIYNRALSEEEIRYHYNHTLPKGAVSPTAMKEDSSLVGYWSFNEGSGQIAYDKSGNGNNGTIHGAVWTAGKSGSALKFDGTDDYVDCGNDESLNITDAVTVEAWIRYSSSFSGVRGDVVSKHDYGYKGYGFAKGNDDRIHWWPADGSSWNELISTITISPDTWYHIACTNDANYRKIYINGIERNSGVGVAAIASSSLSLMIGENAEGESYFDGLIDEVRIYNRALTEKEIQEHYRESKYYLASKFGPGTDCDTDPGSCMDYGLVGYWSFDEGSGSTAYDASDNGNNGTIYGAKWAQGAPALSGGGTSGTGLSFDGENDYVDCGSDESFNYLSEITIELWAKNTGITAYGQNLVYAPSNVWILHYRGAGFYLKAEDGTTSGYLHWDTSLSSGVWLHLVATWDGGTMRLYINGEKQTTEKSFGGGATGRLAAPGGLYIGKYFNSTQPWFNGLIDEVRIYNRALSEEEIRYHYNRGAPVAHWKFDEGEGSTAYDSTDNNNDGTIHGATWTSGKHGSALKFDGVDDYVEAPDSASLDTESLTITVWFKLNQNPDCDGNNNYRSFMRKGSIAGTSNGWDIVLEEDGDVCFDVSGTRWWPLGRAKQLLGWPIGEWHFYAFTYDASTGVMKFYKDGKFIDSHTKTPGSIISNTASVAISKGTNAVSCPSGSGFVPGEYDDVRIYNYARTPEQIKQDYNAGLSTHFR